MAGLSVSGLGSGLDIEGIVSQLMTIERQPLTKLDTKEAGVQAKISAFGALKGSLSSLQNAIAGLKLPSGTDALDFYSTYKGSVANADVATVSAGEGTVPGNYSLEVTQLAKENRLISKAGTAIGTGTLTIELGSEDGSSTVKSTAINITSNKLTDIRDAINNSTAGVTAAVVNGVDGQQLVLTGNQGGSKQFISLSGISGLEYAPDAPTTNFSQQQPAQSAKIKLNGIEVESQSNKVTDALEGVTLELKKETDGTPTTLTLTRDTSSINKALDKFVTAYNEYNKLSKQLGGYDAETRKGGALLGDSALRGADSKLRTMLSSVPSGFSDATMRTLSDIGISLQKDGSLKLDNTKLEKALSKDFAGVANVAAAYGKSMDGVITNLIGTEGLITSKTEGLKDSVSNIDKQRTALERRLTNTEARLRAQYVALDSVVSGMLQTGNYLEKQLASLTG